MVFRGLPIDTADHTQFFPEFNELRCSSYYLTPSQMEIYRQKAWEYKPDFIKCYPSSGYIFASYLKESGKPFPQIKGILCASENLYDFQKKLLSQVFNCRVFSHYGHYELAVIAGFCEYEDTYHVLPFYGYAELIDNKGRAVATPGEVGEIVATSFIMKGTPFIRYRTRDFAVFKSFGCPRCGRPYQIWDRIEGRLQEFIITKAGRYISMTAMNMHDDVFDKLKQFQYYQDKRGVVEFRYIPKGELSAKDVAVIGQRLKVKLGKDVDLSFRKVSNIPLTGRGKFRFLVQELDLKYGD
jgi:phenylacetate-CoA ligase